MDGPRRGHHQGRRPSAVPGASADPRRAAAAREAMARMEEMMLAHAGAAGEFSIVLDAPLPSLQQYRRNPTPPPGPSSSPHRHRGGGRRREEEEVPARLRREGSVPDAVGDADAARASRRNARPRPEEMVEAPVRLVDPRGARRPPGRGATPPPTRRVAEVRRVVAEKGEEEEVETPPQLLARGGRSSSATKPADAPRVVEAAAANAFASPVRLVDPRGPRRPASRGATPPPGTRVPEARRVVAEKEEETPLQLLARGGRSSNATRHDEEAPREVVPAAADAVARPSSRRSRRDGGVKAVAAEVAMSVEDEVESVGRGSSRGSEDGGEEAAALPRPLAAVITGGRSRSNSPAISNVKDNNLISQFI